MRAIALFLKVERLLPRARSPATFVCSLLTQTQKYPQQDHTLSVRATVTERRSLLEAKEDLESMEVRTSAKA